MIPNDQKTIDELRKLAARNIAKGDWGDEVSAPNEVVPTSPAETAVTKTISKTGGRRLPKRK